MTTLPAPITYGQVRWRVFTALPDTNADTDALPDAVSVIGKVTFTPSVMVLLTSGTDPTTVILQPLVYNIGSDGLLRDAEGRDLITLPATDAPGVSPTGWTWRVDYRLEGLLRGPFSFALPTGSVVDLTRVAPVAASNGTPVIKGDKGDPGPAGPPGLSGPAGPPGLSGGLTPTDIAQTDYVETLRGLSNYTTMTVKKVNAAGALQVICKTPGGKSVTYEITDAARYQYVGQVLASGAPDPSYQVASTRTYPTNVTLMGTYLGTGSTSSAHYTTTVGSTWTTQITTTSPNAKVTVTTFTDNRGGRWNLDLVEAPAVAGTFTTWAASGTNTTRADVLTIPTAGTYTLRATFAGADGVNTPAGGVAARGWLIAPDSNMAPVFVSVAESGQPTAVTLSPQSNKDFAFSIKPAAGGGAYEFVPYHGIDTEDFAGPTVYLVDGAPLNVTGMAAGASVTAQSFEIVQHIYGVNSTSPATNLIEVWTKQRFTPNGVYSVSGRWKTLATILADFGVYHLMLPATMPLFDQVVSSVGETRNVAPGMAPTNVWLPGDSDHTDSYAALSSTSDFVAAVRYNSRRETLRVGAPDKRAAGSRTFIELRTGGTMLKVYNSLYAAGTTVPAGSVQRFSGDYWYGESPGINGVLSLT